MQRDTTKRFYIIHSWVGALTAVLMFVVAFTGAVSVFGRPELKIWAHEISHTPVKLTPASMERLLQEDAAMVPATYRDAVQIIMPGVRRSPYLSFYFEHERELPTGKVEHHQIRFDHDPHSLQLLERREGEARELFASDRKDFADFLISFHADLHLGDPIGLMITGILGLTLFASVLTGIVTHRKILREAFTFRPFRSIRLLFTDSHKVLGVWGLMFHATIAFTGAFLGLAIVILLPAAAFVSFEGDLERMVETVLPTDAPARSGLSQRLVVADVLHAAEGQTNSPVVSVQLLEGTDRNAVALVHTLAGDGIVGKTYRYRVNSAELLGTFTQFSRVGGATGPLLDSMFPLHFGNFGGPIVKFLWFILGLGTAFLALSGVMIWLERRTYSSVGKLTPESYARISRLTVGACAGVVLATVALFHVQRVLLPTVADTGPWLFGSFFGLWLLTIGWALLRSNVYKTTKELLGLTGLIAIAVPGVNAIVTGNHLFNVMQGKHWVVAGTDTTMLILGALMILLAFRLPSERPEKVLTARRSKNTSDETDAPTLLRNAPAR